MDIEKLLGRLFGIDDQQLATVHWWMQRVTAVGLIPLSLFILDFLELSRDEPREQIIDWLQSPFNGLCMLLWILTVFYHVKLGLQVVIEDYVGNQVAQTTALWSMKLSVFLVELAALFALFRIFTLD